MAQRVHFPTRASCAYANASERSGSMSIADLVRDGISSVGKDGEVRGDFGEKYRADAIVQGVLAQTWLMRKNCISRKSIG